MTRQVPILPAEGAGARHAGLRIYREGAEALGLPPAWTLRRIVLIAVSRRHAE